MGRWALDSVECPPSQENADGSNMAGEGTAPMGQSAGSDVGRRSGCAGSFCDARRWEDGVFGWQRQSQGYSEGRGRVVWTMRPKRGCFTGGVRIGGRRCADGEGCEMQDARCRTGWTEEAVGSLKLDGTRRHPSLMIDHAPGAATGTGTDGNNPWHGTQAPAVVQRGSPRPKQATPYAMVHSRELHRHLILRVILILLRYLVVSEWSSILITISESCSEKRGSSLPGAPGHRWATTSIFSISNLRATMKGLTVLQQPAYSTSRSRLHYLYYVLRAVAPTRSRSCRALPTHPVRSVTRSYRLASEN